MNKEILVVDDDDIILDYMVDILGDLGFEVFTLSSGVGVDEYIAQRNPAACFIDLVMREREGIETIMAQHGNHERPKLFAMSANLVYLELARNLGVDDVLPKPINPEQLEQLLRQHHLLD